MNCGKQFLIEVPMNGVPQGLIPDFLRHANALSHKQIQPSLRLIQSDLILTVLLLSWRQSMLSVGPKWATS